MKDQGKDRCKILNSFSYCYIILYAASLSALFYQLSDYIKQVLDLVLRMVDPYMGRNRVGYSFYRNLLVQHWKPWRRTRHPLARKIPLTYQR